MAHFHFHCLVFFWHVKGPYCPEEDKKDISPRPSCPHQVCRKGKCKRLTFTFHVVSLVKSLSCPEEDKQDLSPRPSCFLQVCRKGKCNRFTFTFAVFSLSLFLPFFGW